MSSGHSSADFHKRITLAGSLIAIGIVFGDIGTSPLYTLNAVFHGRIISETIALGCLSCIFWTLFLQTTVKYVIITLQADNNGEGGILSLYALIRRYFSSSMLIVAMIGAAFLIADGIITPPISVASAIEGVKAQFPELNTIPIIIAILISLFIFQQFGTDKIGKVFGPVMVIWFGFIGVIGAIALGNNWGVIKALNPYYAYQMLVNEPHGFWLLGSIFLCTTGAEALYSDMGHCGRNNIRVSWIFIKICLVLSYAGQTAWLLNNVGSEIGELSPFYHIVPDILFWPSVIIATFATIIASQALISGCFTLINEAIRLDIWPKHMVLFPSNIKGQLYIPAINWFLMLGCIAMVLYFEESTKMEAAFGLSVTLTMLMSTVLVHFYLRVRRVAFVLNLLITSLFLIVELSFLTANLQKIKEGGWITLVIGAVLFLTMFIWSAAKKLKAAFTKYVNIEYYISALKKLSVDSSIQKYATNIVYLTTSNNNKKIEKSIIDSILKEGIPKRADIYWFVHIKSLDEPYAQEYSVTTIVKNDIYFIEFGLGFREEPRIGTYFKQVISELIKTQEVDMSDSHEMEYQQNSIGDFRFIVMESFLSYDNHLPIWENFIMKSYYNLNLLSVSKSKDFGLDASHLTIEQTPIVMQSFVANNLKRKE